MYNNDKLIKIKPLIFAKKLNNNFKIIPLKKIIGSLAPMRYFPTSTQEWSNSIYSYDNNYIKGITVIDKNLSSLIKSYFNFYFNKKNKKFLSGKHMITRFRRLGINKIFISKAELKHTSSKVIITLYIYNEERRILARRIKRIESILFNSIKLPTTVGKNRVLSLKEKLNIIKQEKENVSFENWLKALILSIFEEIKVEKNTIVYIKKIKDKTKKQLEIKILEKSLDFLLKVIAICEHDPLSYKYYKDLYGKFVSKTLLEKEIMTISYYKLLLNLNKFKFEDKFLLKLKPLISKIYNKEVEFNIVNLKAIHLNSDIFTQAISLKLKNRNNKLLKVLRSFLYMVKLPKVNVIRERFDYVNYKELWINKVKNLKVNYLFFKNKDSLNQLLFNLFNNSNFLVKSEHNKENKSLVNTTNNLLNNVLDSLKNKTTGGVRLEAKGRLTRRFTASRSVFKIKWKGSLKNIDSSYKGLSSVILRGHIKSNVQYSVINSKTRNGAFGLKGWISGK
jgi:hypothetical protein